MKLRERKGQMEREIRKIEHQLNFLSRIREVRKQNKHLSFVSKVWEAKYEGENKVSEIVDEIEE